METHKGKISVKIIVNPVWLKEHTDLSQCRVCGEIIYSDIYRLWIMPYVDKLRLTGEKTEIKLCESCCNLATA